MVDDAGDTVVEQAGEGLGYGEVDRQLYAGRQLETLILSEEGGAINGAGSGGNNNLFGNSSDNILNGAGGNDFLDGKGGNDTMYGGIGDDTYVVAETGDIVVENAGGGTADKVQSYIDYALGAELENHPARQCRDRRYRKRA